jgi:hypothetical protein
MKTEKETRTKNTADGYFNMMNWIIHEINIWPRKV